MKAKEYDGNLALIRVVAMFFVVGVHVVSHMPTDSPQRVFFNYIFNLLFLTCNGIFYMLSGKFALQTNCEKWEEYIKYYYKKTVNLVVPMLFYMLLRCAVDSGWNILNADFCVTFLKNIVSGYSGSEYWYLYVLLGNIILAPFLGRILSEIGNRELWIFIMFGLVYNAFVSYTPLFLESEWKWNFPLGSWNFYFYLGYSLERLIDTRKKKIGVMLLGVISFGISLWQLYHGKASYLYDLAPTFTFITCTVYFVLKSIPVNSVSLKRIIIFLGRHSFSVYMIHMSVLYRFMDKYPFESHFLLYLFGVSTAIVLISLVLGVILDTTILALIKRMLMLKPIRFRTIEKG